MNLNLKKSLLFFLLGLTSLLVSAQNISIEVEEQSLSKTLEQIAQQYDLRISFDTDVLSKYTVSIKAENEGIEQFLDRLLAPYHLAAKRSKKNFFYVQSTQRKLLFILRDQEKKEPIPYASASIKDTYKGNTANERGEVELSFDQRDTLLMLGGFGYKSVEFNPSNFEGDTVQLYLDIASVDLKTVTILEYLNRGIRLIGDLSSPTLLLSEMQVLPGLPETDALLSAQMLPGFESNDETAASINVRGSEQAQTLIYWDRIPVYQPAHYFGQITSIIPSMTERIDSYKNYIPSYFSGATSGLLNMKADDSLAASTSFISNTNFTHSDLSVKSPIQKNLSLQLAARFSYNHLLNTPLFDAYSDKLFDGVRAVEEDEVESDVESKLQFWDVNAKLIFEPNSKNYFSISTIVNDDQSDFSGSESMDSSQLIQDHIENFKGVNAFFRHEYNSTWSSKISLSITDYSAKNLSSSTFIDDEGLEFDSIFISNDLNSIELKTAVEYLGGGNNRIEFGYQLHQYQTQLQLRERSTYEGAITEDRKTNESANGIYALSEINFGKLLLRPQIRLDYFSREEELNISPVINTQYQLSKGLWLKASYGIYSQALSTINDVSLSASNVSSSIWVLAGEDDTEVLRSKNSSFGILLQQKGWIIDLDFYNRNTIGVSAINTVDVAVSEELEFELGESNSRGLDFMLKKNFGKYHSWLSYTYSKTANTFDSLGQKFASSLDRPHQLRWVNSYLINQFEISLGWTYKSGAPYTQGEGLIYDAEEDEYAIVYEEINSNRLPIYHRLDFSFWYRFPNEKSKVNGVVGISLMNVYNRENVWKRFYRLEDVDDDDVPDIEEEERFFLGLTPNISLKLSF